MGPTEAHPTGLASTPRPHAPRQATRRAPRQTTRDTTGPTVGTPGSTAPRASIPGQGTTRPSLLHLFRSLALPTAPLAPILQAPSLLLPEPDSHSSAAAHSSRSPSTRTTRSPPTNSPTSPETNHAVPQPDPTRPPLVPLLRTRDRLHVSRLTPGPRSLRPVIFSNPLDPMDSRSETTNLPGSPAGPSTRRPSRSRSQGSHERTSAVQSTREVKRDMTNPGNTSRPFTGFAHPASRPTRRPACA